MKRIVSVWRWLPAAAVGGVAVIYGFGADDLSRLSDEFDDAGTLANWSRVQQVEGWNADQMQSWDIDDTRPGYMTLIPKASSWYNNWRGILAFKRVSGDFVATIEIEPRNRAGDGPPNANYSLAGIMARAPRDNIQQPSDWTPGGENYIFLSAGAASNPGTYQFEVKTTVNSQSTLQISSGAERVTIQIARIGSVFIALRRLGEGPWEVHQRYNRPDMPAELQVGLTVYTDWSRVSGMDPFVHNQTVIEDGNPDLMAWVDYYRFARPSIPAELAGRDFFNPASVSDAEAIAFLGDNANLPAPTLTEASVLEHAFSPGVALNLTVATRPGSTYTLLRSADLEAWQTVETKQADGDSLEFKMALDGETSADPVFARVAGE